MSRNWMLAALGLLLLVPSVLRADVGSLKKDREKLAEEVKAKQKQLGDLRQEANKSDSLAKLQAEVAAASKAVQAKEHADADVQAAHKKADEASKARDAVVKAAILANPEGAKIQKEIDAEEARIKAAADQINKLRGKLFVVRQTLEKDKGGRVAEADASAKKVRDTLNAAAAKVTTSERAALDKARAAVDAKANEIFNQNPKAVDLKKAIDALVAKDSAISKEIHNLEHPKPAAKKEEAKPKTDKPKSDKPKEEAKPKTDKPKDESKPKSDKPKEEAKPKK